MLYSLDSMQTTWEILFAAPEGRNEVRWFCKRNDSLTTLGNIAKNVGELSRAALASSRGWDCFVHLNPSKGVKGLRAKSSDVCLWAFVLIDIDPVGKEPLCNINETELSVADTCKNIVARVILNNIQAKAEELLGTLLDPAIIYTGRGYHLWLRLKPIPVWRDGVTMDLCRPDAKKIENATRNFLTELTKHAPEGVRIDVLPDLARIARLPNSINQKTGRYARLIQSGSQQDIGQIILDKFGSRNTASEQIRINREFMQKYDELVEAQMEDCPKGWCGTNVHNVLQGYDKDLTNRYKKFREVYTGVYNPHYTFTVKVEDSIHDWRDVFWTLTKRARDYIDHGASEGSRHEAMFATCRSLFEKGVEKESASEALRIGNRRCHEPLGNMEINRQLTRIYK